MLQNNEKLISNQIKRTKKREREQVRKLNGTYVYKKAPLVINKWGKPYYEKVKIETRWKRCQSNNSRYVFWVNPVTHQILEDYNTTGEPEPHIHYSYQSTGPLVSLEV